MECVTRAVARRKLVNMKQDDLTVAGKKRVYEAITAKFGARLRPGEGLSVNLDQNHEHIHLEIVLESISKEFRLSLETAVVASESDVASSAADRLDIALDFLDLQFEDYFESGRDMRFHSDWRAYEIDKKTVRFRGRISNPNLEDAATQFLTEHDGHGWEV
jgi:hypothetical protein